MGIAEIDEIDDNLGIQNEDEKVKKEEERIKTEHEYLNSCIKDIMNRQSGRHFLLWIIESCGMSEDTFNPDSHIHARNAGARSIAVRLTKKLLSVCPNHYYKMEQEHKYIEEEG